MFFARITKSEDNLLCLSAGELAGIKAEDKTPGVLQIELFHQRYAQPYAATNGGKILTQQKYNRYPSSAGGAEDSAVYYPARCFCHRLIDIRLQLRCQPERSLWHEIRRKS